MLQKLTLITLLIIASVGCVQITEPPKNSRSQLAVSSVWDIPTQFEKGSTFALSPRYLKEISLKEEQQQTYYQWYANALIENLKGHGYTLSNDTEAADFFVGYGVALSQDLDDKKISEKFGVTPGLQAGESQEKGSFLIYVEDGVTKQRIWRGAVQGVVQSSQSKTERKRRAITVTNTVMQHFYNNQ